MALSDPHWRQGRTARVLVEGKRGSGPAKNGKRKTALQGLLRQFIPGGILRRRIAWELRETTPVHGMLVREGERARGATLQRTELPRRRQGGAPAKTIHGDGTERVLRAGGR